MVPTYFLFEEVDLDGGWYYGACKNAIRTYMKEAKGGVCMSLNHGDYPKVNTHFQIFYFLSYLLF